jgi:hypothetical protein
MPTQKRSRRGAVLNKPVMVYLGARLYRRLKEAVAAQETSQSAFLREALRVACESVERSNSSAA